MHLGRCVWRGAFETLRLNLCEASARLNRCTIALSRSDRGLNSLCERKGLNRVNSLFPNKRLSFLDKRAHLTEALIFAERNSFLKAACPLKRCRFKRRLNSLASSEKAIELVVGQACAIRNLGESAECFTLGHNPYKFDLSASAIHLPTMRPRFLCEELAERRLRARNHWIRAVSTRALMSEQSAMRNTR